MAEWAQNAPIWQSDHQFSLSHLGERLRWEVLYALQQRDNRGAKIDPSAVRQSVGRLITMPSLSTMSETEVQNFISQSSSCNANAYTSEFARVLRVSRDRSEGRTPTDRLIWDLVEVGMQTDPTPAGGTRRRVGLDFSPITQTWLRTLAMTWARKQDNPELVAEVVRACAAVSLLLSQRPDCGNDMGKLGEPDAEHIAESFGRLTKVNGALMSPRYQRYLHQRFFDIIKYGRVLGYLDELPQSFRPNRKKLPQDSVEDDDTGKAIPQYIQRQLDANTDLIGRPRVTDSMGRSQAPYRHLHTHRAGMNDEDVHEMYRTAYIVMRDTGRRPVEVLALKMDCLDSDGNGLILIWNNFKSGRLNRRLPIGQSTADVLKAWFDRRPQINAPERSSEYAFPAMSAHARKPHVASTTFAHIMRTWVDGLDRLDTNDLDEDGNPRVCCTIR
ncbi:hypothetical protein ACJH6J_30350 [Mycobacterium sp. SMC-18]|uniref:hypothetical protein n=1 Tax=Mycobacterium sp. SMC-18 TaxID=3381629 RepID=UPI0038761338